MLYSLKMSADELSPIVYHFSPLFLSSFHLFSLLVLIHLSLVQQTCYWASTLPCALGWTLRIWRYVQLFLPWSSFYTRERNRWVKHATPIVSCLFCVAIRYPSLGHLYGTLNRTSRWRWVEKEVCFSQKEQGVKLDVRKHSICGGPQEV